MIVVQSHLAGLLEFVNERLAANNGMTADEVRTLAVKMLGLEHSLEANEEEPQEK